LSSFQILFENFGKDQNPYFSIPLILDLVEDAGLYKLDNIATNMNPGIAVGELLQTWTFEVVALEPNMFSHLPNITADGTLELQTSPNVNGNATLNIRMVDSGGNFSDWKTTILVISPVNDAPSFTLITNLTVSENISCFVKESATNFISPGPLEASQKMTFVIDQVSGDNLTVSLPYLDMDGNLSFCLKKNSCKNQREFCWTEYTVTLVDSGDKANGGMNTLTSVFTLFVAAVNHAPSFDLVHNATFLQYSGRHQLDAFAYNMDLGADDEQYQVLHFNVTTTNTSDHAFKESPGIFPNGTFHFCLAQDWFGPVFMEIFARDNGGSNYGGSDQSSTQSVSFDVLFVNQPPTFELEESVSLLENSVNHSVTVAYASFARNITVGPDIEVQ
jgi:hypothetical protein